MSILFCQSPIFGEIVLQVVCHFCWKYLHEKYFPVEKYLIQVSPALSHELLHMCDTLLEKTKFKWHQQLLTESNTKFNWKFFPSQTLLSVKLKKFFSLFSSDFYLLSWFQDQCFIWNMLWLEKQYIFPSFNKWNGKSVMAQMKYWNSIFCINSCLSWNWLGICLQSQ